MSRMIAKLAYLARAATTHVLGGPQACPNCGSTAHKERDRKFFFTRLVRCDDCELMFRTPVDSESYSHKFYNLFYVEGDSMICPSAEEITRLKASNFVGHDRSFAHYISFLNRNGISHGARVFDFGCNWGYGSYQFAQAGFDTHSFEIAETRRNYGIENLGVKHVDDPDAIQSGHPLYQSFDCFFSAHVIEHVPSPSKVFDLAWRCLKPGGLFVAFLPNGCEGYRRNHPQGWHNMWGEVHPNFIDDQFYNKHFPRSEKQFVACDGGDVMQNYELGFVARKQGDAGF